MSTLTYLDNDDVEIYDICYIESNRDHAGRVWDLLSVEGNFEDYDYPVPCSRRLKEWLDSHDGLTLPDDLPGQLIIVEADGCESGEFPFTTSDCWLTFADPDKPRRYGTEEISLGSARQLLRKRWQE